MFQVTIKQKKNIDIVSLLQGAIGNHIFKHCEPAEGGYIQSFVCYRWDDGYTKFADPDGKKKGFAFGINEGENAHFEVWEDSHNTGTPERYKAEAFFLEDLIGRIAYHFPRSFDSLEIRFFPELQAGLWTKGLMKETLLDKYYKFYHLDYTEFSESVNSNPEFCQSFPSRFQHDGVAYETVEHWIAAKKAEMFSDKTSLDKILGSKCAKDAKRLGKKVKNVDDETWNEKIREVATEGNWLKFSKNIYLLSKLKKTNDHVLVYANKRDLYWGAGLRRGDRYISLPQKWEGENVLGFVLMEVRSILKEGGTPASSLHSSK